MTTDRATERDMRTAKAALNYGPDEQVSPMDAEYVENIASLLAAKRARVLAPVLALADRWDSAAVNHDMRGDAQLATRYSAVARQVRRAAQDGES